MRRLIDLKQPSRLLNDCACSLRPSVSSSPASRCLVQHQHRDFSTPAGRRPYLPQEGKAGDTYRISRPYATSSKNPLLKKKVYEPRNGLVEEYLPDLDPDLDLVDIDIATDIKPPGRLTAAPPADQVDDAAYTPAVTADGLEEIGGVADWWEDDRHWSTSLQYAGFGRRENITDAAVLEALARRAVVEALAVREIEGEQALGASWRQGGREALVRSLEVKIEVDQNGAAVLEGDVRGVVGDLKTQPQSSHAEAPETQSPAEDLEQHQSQDDFVLPCQEANEYRKSWDRSWKAISLEDLRLKFAVNKRVQQLTGHIIPDHKLLTVRNVAGYLAVLVKPPPPKKLSEVIERKGELLSLPNVKVYPRRVTPIDKEKMVGRWKVIVRELEKRELPVVGMADYGKTPERKWATGKS